MLQHLRGRILLTVLLLGCGSGGVAAPGPGLTAAARSPHCETAGLWLKPGPEGPQRLKERALLDKLAGRAVVLLGERHDRADDHRWQLETLTALQAKRPDLVLGLEMLPRRVQLQLDRWLAGSDSPEALEQAVNWQQVWGYDPSLYRPLLLFARTHRLRLLALNVDRSLPRRVAREGLAALPATERRGLGQPAAASPAYRARLRAAWLGHGHQGGEATAFERFVESQLVWDRAMAETIAAELRRRPGALVVALVGRGHLEYGDGIPSQLRDLGISATASLLPWPVAERCERLSVPLADAVQTRAAAAPPPPPPGVRLGAWLESQQGIVTIRAIAPGSAAAAAGLRLGDVIEAVNGEPVGTAAQVIMRVRRLAADQPLRLRLRREGRRLERQLRLPPPAGATAAPGTVGQATSAFDVPPSAGPHRRLGPL
ncbi:MAG: ChaN family lipoprotein [Synechococcaceae cyanobacterium]|nr:ChaN family lipoprotein [Synechococcaceae cyanobacterium]